MVLEKELGGTKTPVDKVALMVEDRGKLLSELERASKIAGARVGLPILVYNVIKASIIYIQNEASRLEDAHQEGYNEGQKDAEDQYNEDGYL